MERNHTMMQFFEWHVPADQKHWKRLKERASKLKKAGITALWLPPVTKGQSDKDTGYGVYDLYDLGEFDQKGTVATKYGTKQELLEATKHAQELGMQVYMDVVLNHKAGADATEKFDVLEVDSEDRTKVLSEEPFEIEGWTKFDYKARNNKYSSFKWNFHHFNGTDYDAASEHSGIFFILGDNKKWNDNVDSEFGVYDYLMFANIDYHHPEVREEVLSWGKWFIEETKCDGFRLDAIKHINYDFVKEFSQAMEDEKGENFYLVGEFWKSELEDCRAFLDNIDYHVDLFDVPLHYNLQRASIEGASFDLRTIFDDTLVQSHPRHSVTFVDNHDSQPSEALESWVGDWFKQSAYGLILLRQDGYPCVFYGDYYGIGGPHPIEGKKQAIDPLLYARREKAYGQQDDYFDNEHVIGWVRHGSEDIERSGCAVIISNDEEAEKRMYVGEHRAGEKWVDLTQTIDEIVEIDEDGKGVFKVAAGSISVWALPDEDVE
ncbi:alpha-amylase [Exiguobacterium sp. S17]|nr:alpha-amylase [Exiguobacterium sp. S17]